MGLSRTNSIDRWVRHYSGGQDPRSRDLDFLQSSVTPIVGPSSGYEIFPLVLLESNQEGKSSQGKPDDHGYDSSSIKDSPSSKSQSGKSWLDVPEELTQLGASDSHTALAWYAPLTIFSGETNFFISISGFSSLQKRFQTLLEKQRNSLEAEQLATQLTYEFVMQRLSFQHQLESLIIRTEFLIGKSIYGHYFWQIHGSSHCEEIDIAGQVAADAISAGKGVARALVPGERREITSVLEEQNIRISRSKREREERIWELLSGAFEQQTFFREGAQCLDLLQMNGLFTNQLISTSKWVNR